MQAMRLVLLLTIAALFAAEASAQTSQPAGDWAALAIRANQEFNRGQYALALPMFQKLAELAKDQPALLGPVEEKIRVCQANLQELDGTGGKPTAPSLSIDRKPHPPPGQGKILEMSIKDLGNFDYDAQRGGNIPSDVMRLSGATVRLRGFMIPMEQTVDITRFALVPDLFACCFGQPPQIQHTVIVNCPPGKAVSYYPDEISVEGKLTVSEQRDEGFIVSIFQLEAWSVKPLIR